MSHAAELDAMSKVFGILEPLDEKARMRVLAWVSDHLNVRGTGGAEQPEAERRAEGWKTFAELFEAAQPNTNGERALVGGYWLQVCKGLEDFDSASVNKELQNLGHPVVNITDAFDQLRSRKPALAIQVRKSGKSQQARKKYKLTQAGIKKVEDKLQV